MSLFCFGLSHHTAPLDVRERFTVPSFALPEALARLKTMPGVEEGLILSTCNRTEFYVSGEVRNWSDQSFFENFYGDLRAADERHLCQFRASDCVRHLFRVSAGLESMVFGETEIFGQVKCAYELARSAKTTGKLLNRLFQKSFQVGKQLRNTTGITRGNVSVSSVAVDLAEQIFGDLHGRKIMVVGAGEIGLKTARAFRSRGAEEIFVSNRRFERAQALATLTGGRAVYFEDWEPEFRDLDILVSCTAAPHPILTLDKLTPLWRVRRQGPLFMIDLAVPRDIDPEVERLDDVYLYDLDSIQLKAEKSLADRKRESEKCCHLIERHVQEFALWLEHSPPAGAGCFVPEFAVT
jgi:glutamyl-tRNA reductase